MDYFRNIQIYKRKLQKAISKKNEEQIKRLKENKPQIDLNHIVRERYENFEDVLKDLDDCLSTLALF
jgi:pescadillo protein